MAFAFVKTAANVANANTVTFTPTSGADLLVVDSMTSSGAGSPTASIADDQSSAWQTAIATSAPGADFLTRFYLPNCSAAITLITLTYAGGTPGTTLIQVMEYSGIATSSPHIASAGPVLQTNPGVTTDIISSGNINFTTQPALIIATSFDVQGNSINVGTGFTSRANNASAAYRIEDARITANGNAAGTFSSPTHGATDTFFTWASGFAEPPTGNLTINPGAVTFGGNVAGVRLGSIITPATA